ncbi:MAG: HD domain-containing protein [Clostridium sp.]
MDRVNKILNSERYQNLLNRLDKLEANRIFCKHNIEHFLDLARIAYIKVLEDNLNYNKEVIYAIALLHDIGRVDEYEKGISHHEASSDIAKDILMDIDFSSEEKILIIECIEGHRNDGAGELSQIISKSDKLSRLCFSCPAEKSCYWNKEKKNMIIKI